MERQQAFEIIKETFSNMFFDDVEITEETSMEDVESWNSMSQVSFLVELEKAFGIRFKMEDLPVCRSLGKILDTVMGLI